MQSFMKRCTNITLCLAMVGCVIVNNTANEPAAPTAKKSDGVPSDGFNIVHNASGLCATIVQSNTAAHLQTSYEVVLTPCRHGVLSQTFVQDPLTSQIMSPAVPNTCLVSALTNSPGTPRGRVLMMSCTKNGIQQGWKFLGNQARVAFYDRMVLDASDPINVNGRPSWLGFPLKTWGAPEMSSPNLDFSQRPIVNP